MFARTNEMIIREMLADIEQRLTDYADEFCAMSKKESVRELLLREQLEVIAERISIGL